mmetsp:Transcript_53204/g.126573  ORF Transcript_53204/g.126573 Transcript_53204/m.126573 type:complete len:204 (-) Transcript_53204:576-1187(-)
MHALDLDGTRVLGASFEVEEELHVVAFLHLPKVALFDVGHFEADLAVHAGWTRLVRFQVSVRLEDAFDDAFGRENCDRSRLQLPRCLVSREAVFHALALGDEHARLQNVRQKKRHVHHRLMAGVLRGHSLLRRAARRGFGHARREHVPHVPGRHQPVFPELEVGDEAFEARFRNRLEGDRPLGQDLDGGGFQGALRGLLHYHE